jgi:hypothetical protein
MGSKIGVHPIGWPQNRKMGVVHLWVLGYTSGILYPVAKLEKHIHWTRVEG